MDFGGKRKTISKDKLQDEDAMSHDGQNKIN